MLTPNQTHRPLHHVLAALVAVVAVAIIAGCEGPPAKPTQPQTSTPPSTTPTAPASSSSSVVPEPSKGTTAWGPVLPDSSPAPATPAAAAKPAQTRPATPPAATPPKEKPAAVGVGKKGRGYGEGVVATPAASYWAIRERVAFDIQIPEAMKLFKAMEGRAPKDHNEFMEKIIKANNIHLPELPEGDRYRYDPKTELLMVDPAVRE